MPIYDFRCPNCHTELNSQFMKIDHNNPKCPLCETDMKKNYAKMRINLIYEENDSINYDLDHKPVRYNTLGQLKRIAKEKGCELYDP